MREILIATTNTGKYREMIQLLNLPEVSLISVNELRDRPILTIDETGKNFSENALLKARIWFNQLGIPVITDDSGLVVPALGGAPGVHSARFAGPESSDEQNNQKLLAEMKDLSGGKRRARFECVLVYKDNETEKMFSGRCNGSISSQPSGGGGFGYDPLFYIESLHKTFAELNLEEKNRISHRARAAIKLRLFLIQQLALMNKNG